MKSLTQDGNIGIKEVSRALKEEGVLQSCWQYELQVWQNQASESSQGACCSLTGRQPFPHILPLPSIPVPSAGRTSLPTHPNNHPIPELPLSLFYSIFLYCTNPSCLASGRNLHSQYQVSDLGLAQTGMLKLHLKAISTSF